MTCAQLEWTALSQRSGKSIYGDKSQKIFRAIHDVYPDQVWPCTLLGQPSCTPLTAAPPSDSRQRASAALSLPNKAQIVVVISFSPGRKVLMLRRLLPRSLTPVNAPHGGMQITAVFMSKWQAQHRSASLQIFLSLFAYTQGLVPTKLTRATGVGGPSFSVGAMADSYYEYLLKLWLLDGQKANS